jgi:hypothetical protein
VRNVTVLSPEPSIRLLRPPLASAERCPAQFGKVRPSRLTVPQANGLRYENKVQRALTALAKRLGATLERNPWFRYIDRNGQATCSPDAILRLVGESIILVIEVKTTWTPVAATKLLGLYVPVVQFALAPQVIRSLVICKNLLPESPYPATNISAAMLMSPTEPEIYQWRGEGPLVW